jgi:hypothetical protein
MTQGNLQVGLDYIRVEFVVKNIILLCAGLVIGATVRHRASEMGHTESLELGLALGRAKNKKQKEYKL